MTEVSEKNEKLPTPPEEKEVEDKDAEKAEVDDLTSKTEGRTDDTTSAFSVGSLQEHQGTKEEASEKKKEVEFTSDSNKDPTTDLFGMKRSADPFTFDVKCSKGTDFTFPSVNVLTDTREYVCPIAKLAQMDPGDGFFKPTAIKANEECAEDEAPEEKPEEPIKLESSVADDEKLLYESRDNIKLSIYKNNEWSIPAPVIIQLIENKMCKGSLRWDMKYHWSATSISSLDFVREENSMPSNWHWAFVIKY